MRKHLTRAERQARESAEASLQRTGRVSIHAPKWLSVEARVVFDKTKRRMKGLELLDNMDADALAIYADSVVRHKDATDPKERQAWARVVAMYMEKLGIGANARARLAKRTADQPHDAFESLLDDVEEFVNGNVR